MTGGSIDFFRVLLTPLLLFRVRAPDGRVAPV